MFLLSLKYLQVVMVVTENNLGILLLVNKKIKKYKYKIFKVKIPTNYH